MPDYGLMVGHPAQLVGYVCRQGHWLLEASDSDWHCPICDETVTLGSEAAAALAQARSASPGLVRRLLGKN